MASANKRPKMRHQMAWLKEEILMRARWRCQYCGYDGTQSRHKMTVDHILPKSRGGDESYENLCACCRSCNEEKAGRTVAEWRAGIARRFCVGKPLTDEEIDRVKALQRRLRGDLRSVQRAMGLGYDV